MKITKLRQQQKNAASSRRSNTQSVTSLEDFASVIEEGRREGKLVVVRFHATWCKVSN
jgi:thiol:disulfide interchange protein